MDLIYRKEKYARYLQKLDKLKGNHPIIEENDHVNIIRESVNEILEDLRDKSDIVEIKILYAILSVPLIIVLGILWYLNGINPALFVLITVLLYFVFAVFTMTNIIKENKSLRIKNGIDQDNDETFLSNKISYASSAIGIKEKRNELVQIFYALFFPLLLYFSYVLILGNVPFNDMIIGLIVAYLISTPLWYYFFDREKMDIRTTRQILDNYRRHFKSI